MTWKGVLSSGIEACIFSILWLIAMAIIMTVAWNVSALVVPYESSALAISHLFLFIVVLPLSLCFAGAALLYMYLKRRGFEHGNGLGGLAVSSIKLWLPSLGLTILVFVVLILALFIVFGPDLINLPGALLSAPPIGDTNTTAANLGTALAVSALLGAILLPLIPFFLLFLMPVNPLFFIPAALLMERISNPGKS